MKKINYLTATVLILLLAGFQASCKPKEPSDLSKEVMIPRPVTVTPTGDFFKLTPGSSVIIREDNPEIRKTAQFLSDLLKTPTGFAVNVVVSQGKAKSGSFILNIDKARSSMLGNEGYELVIDKRIITITSAEPAGLFHAVQTIRQLLPVQIESKTLQPGPWEIPTGTITDYPEYGFRGTMIDVSRHFFPAEDIKTVIDNLAYYKMNMLHLHLSDDQGWRIEIKSWPNLATHGGKTEVGGGEGGYYTQEVYADLVKYAQDRYITIIPEIDMPGHTNAALSSYPELNCSDKAPDLYTGTNVGFSTLCVNKDITYKFIDDVFRELVALTPGPYIHIGGDESHATKKEDYILFENKVQDLLAKYGKTIIGWDEISQSTMKPGTVAHFWSNVENANKAVSQGAKVLMSPAKKAYLDMKYTKETKLGLRWAGLIEVDTAYAWNPSKYAKGIGKENVFGIEAALWTETITNLDEMEFMVFPRLPGYAEIGWTPQSLRSWDEYKVRLGNHGARLTARGINYYKSPLVPWVE